MNTDIVSAVQVLILMGLPTLALLGMGMWVLRREFGGVARGVGFLIIALGSVLGIVTFTTVLFGIVGVMEGVHALAYATRPSLRATDSEVSLLHDVL